MKYFLMLLAMSIILLKRKNKKPEVLSVILENLAVFPSMGNVPKTNKTRY